MKEDISAWRRKYEDPTPDLSPELERSFREYSETRDNLLTSTASSIRYYALAAIALASISLASQCSNHSVETPDCPAECK